MKKHPAIIWLKFSFLTVHEATDGALERNLVRKYTA